MRHDRFLVLGSVLIGAIGMVVAGCGSSSTPSDGAAGKTGAGGAADSGPGSGGSGVDSATDHTVVTDGGADSPTDTGAGGAAADAHPDLAVDSSDTGAAHDAASDGPCMTFFGAANPVVFAFNGGVNVGWYQFIVNDNANSMLATSLGASFTDGHSCAGALQFAVNFTAYGSPTAHGESGATEYFFGTSPAGANWTGYKALHAWIKAETPDPLGFAGVYFYVKSGNKVFYQSDFGASSDLTTGWTEVVIDLTRAPAAGAGVAINDVQLIGFEVDLNMAPPAGAPATPSQVILLADDIWLEALPPTDGGADAGSGQ